MPATAREMAERLGFDFDRYQAEQAIDAGAYYQNRVSHTWRRRGRTAAQAHELGLASYNAGTGNILKAQRACGNRRLWTEISPCLPTITGHHADETQTYVRRIKRWTREMEIGRAHNVPEEWRADIVASSDLLMWEIRKASVDMSCDSAHPSCARFEYRRGVLGERPVIYRICVKPDVPMHLRRLCEEV